MVITNRKLINELFIIISLSKNNKKKIIKIRKQNKNIIQRPES